ncbi:MAG TPA: RlpA-like double-psi beta-barrel domain-containing protein [Candidatus Limnocylindria bacterium]|jgi:hypothetical protein|nr:RlpA-like double-psi beta-barrel domain-containing protein [Candidatus Limnocylindria bacterium]
MSRPIRLQTCEACGVPFAARQLIDGRVRSLYGRRSCLGCSPYGGPRPTHFPPLEVRPLYQPRRDPFAELDRLIARAGVAVFGIALLLPILVSSFARPGAVVVASSSEVATPAEYSLPLPDPIARPRLPAPTPEPTPKPATIVITAPPAAANGSAVTASWYGPGFYENRLPCWQWLQANGQPIQFLPDTWGVAHKSLPCGTMVTLTHGPNTVTVPVVDRGPYIDGREFDLSPRVKSELGCTDLCTVVMQVR